MLTVVEIVEFLCNVRQISINEVKYFYDLTLWHEFIDDDGSCQVDSWMINVCMDSICRMDVDCW